MSHSAELLRQHVWAFCVWYWTSYWDTCLDGYCLAVLFAYVIVLSHYNVYAKETTIVELKRSYHAILEIQPGAPIEQLSFRVKVAEAIVQKFTDLTSSARRIIAWDEDWPQGLIGVGLVLQHKSRTGFGFACFSGIVSISKGILIPTFRYLLASLKMRLLKSRIQALTVELQEEWARAMGPPSSLVDPSQLRTLVLQSIVDKITNGEIESKLQWYLDDRFEISQPVWTKAQEFCDVSNVHEHFIQPSFEDGDFLLLVFHQGNSSQRCRSMQFTAKAFRKAAFTMTACLDAGFSLSECYDAEFSAKEFRIVGISASKCKTAGFVISDFMAMDGFHKEDIPDAGFSAADCKAAGFSEEDILRLGYFKCPNGHSLELRSLSRGSCDVCGRTEISMGYGCKRCNWDMCRTCFATAIGDDS